MDPGDYIFSVDIDGFAFGRTQGDVQNRPLLGDVDLVPVKHGVQAFPQARLLGKLKQQLASFFGDAVLGVIEEKAGRLDGEPGGALRIVGK